MELEQIRKFIVVAETGNITKAAQQMFITQPTLSIAISRLETEIGAKLFDRQGNKVVLNKCGEMFLEFAQRSLHALDEGVRCVREFSAFTSFQVMYSIPMAGLFSNVRCKYLMENPDISFFQHNYATMAAEAALLERVIDFAITLFPTSSKQLLWQPLCKSSLCVMVAKDHMLATRSCVQIEELAEEIFVVSSLSEDIMRPFADECMKHDFYPQIVLSSDEPEMQYMMLHEMHAVMLQLSSGISTSIPNVCMVPIDGCRTVMEIGVATRRDETLQFQSQKYLDFLCSECQKTE